MKNQTILKLAMTTMFTIACLHANAATFEDAKKWFASKTASVQDAGLLYNSYPDKPVWYTIYKREGGSNFQTTYGCLAPNSFRFISYPANHNTNSYKVLIEVKDGVDCRGGNICQTDSSRTSQLTEGKLPEFVTAHKNGNNCYISYDEYPRVNSNANSAMALMLLKANYQPATDGPLEPSPLNVSVKNAWYGIEGQPTWEINGKRITDIIKATQNDGGSVYIPANMNQYFGGDPLVNQPKVVAVQILDNGKLINLRQKEGKELIYPGVAGRDYWIVQ